MIKQLMQLSLFLLVTGSMLAMGCSKSSTAADNKADSKASDVPAKDTTASMVEAATDKVLVYYLHGDRRCRTCLGIQKTIEQTIQERFGAETAANKLVFQDVNIDQDENKRFIEQFQVSFSSMILARVKGDKTLQWENCDKVWDLAHEPSKLMDYAAERIKTYLAKIEEK